MFDITGRTGRWMMVVIGMMIGMNCLWVGRSVGEVESPGKPVDSELCRIVVNYDEFNLFRYQLRWLKDHLEREPSPAEAKEMIEQIVDQHAKAGVDRLVQCIFSLPWGTSTAGFKTFNRAPNRGWLELVPGMTGFEESGYDLVEFVLERSHNNGMFFLAGLRMNDRHPNAEQQPFFKEHPEWHLGPDFRGAVDYKYEGVRNAVLAFTKEVLDRYDVDGIELDWMRHCHVFRPSEAEENAPLLTDFMVRLRKLMDEAARRRSSDPLLLGVRVPQTIEECRILGFDLEGWARGGVDYICPADFHCIDFNIQVDDFVRCTVGTNCEVYPSIYGTLSIGGARRRGLTHEQFRAAANNYYSFGAQGVSPYNFYTQFMILPGNEFGKASPEFLLSEWPRALGYLTALRDPAEVARGDKHYLFYPLHPNKAVTGVRKHQVIELSRGKTSANGATRLRMADDLRSPRWAATLAFKVAGMVGEDQLEVAVNDTVFPTESIQRTFDADGQSKDEGRQMAPFYRYEVELTSPPAVFGDNQVQLRLLQSSGTKKLVAQEFEIYVRNVEQEKVE